MSKKTPSRLNLFATTRRQARLIWRLMQDSRVSVVIKIIPIVGLLYAISPIDLLPDVAFPFGILDDIVVVITALTMFVPLVPHKIVEEQISWMDAAEITIDDLQDLQEDSRTSPSWEEEEEE